MVVCARKRVVMSQIQAIFRKECTPSSGCTCTQQNHIGIPSAITFFIKRFVADEITKIEHRSIDLQWVHLLVECRITQF